MSEDDFVERFSPFASESSLVLPTKTDMNVGDTGRFLITLEDRSPIMRGRCEVVEVRPAQRGSEGLLVRVHLLQMDERSRAVHARLVNRLAGTNPTASPRNSGPKVDAGEKVVPTGPEHEGGRPSLKVSARLPGRNESEKKAIGLATNERVRKLENVRSPPPLPVPAHPEASTTPAQAMGPPLSERPAAFPLRPPLPGEGARVQSPAPAAPPPLPALRADPLAAGSEPAEQTPKAAVPGAHAAGGRRFQEEEPILPANPFGDLKTDALGSFVECTLYEEQSVPRGASASLPRPQQDQAAPELAAAFGPTPCSTQTPAPASSSAPIARVPDADEDRTPSVSTHAGTIEDDVLPTRFGELRRRWAALSLRPGLRLPLVGLVAGGLALGALGLAGRTCTPTRDAAAPPPVAPEAPAHVKATTEPLLEDPAAQLVAPVAKPSPASSEVGNVPRTRARVNVAGDREAAGSQVAGGAKDSVCVVNVITQPEDARVFWGARDLGRTPIEGHPVACGKAEVAIRHERYQPVVRMVDARPGEPVVVSQRLVRPHADLIIASNPKAATLTINARAAGQTPSTVTVRRYESVDIRVTKAGYRPWLQRIYVREKFMNIQVDLEPVTKLQNHLGQPPARTAPSTLRPRAPKF